MKPLLFFLLFAATALAQVSTPFRGYTSGYSDPVLCTPGTTPLHWNTTLNVLKRCSSLNTWAGVSDTATPFNMLGTAVGPSVTCSGASSADSASLVAAAAASTLVILPASTCVFDSVELPNNTFLLGQGRLQTIVRPGASGIALKFTGTSGTHKTGLHISGVGFANTSQLASDASYGLLTKFADHVTVDDCGASEITLWNSNVDFTYGSVTSGWVSNHFRASNNVCTTAQSTYGTCIGWHYVNGGIADHNYSSGYGPWSALHYWGGDGNPAVNGAAGNTRWVQNITFSDNTVIGNGLFGSMGQNVTYVGNTILNARDIGLDVEATDGATITGNTCANAVTTCLGTYFYNSNVVFSANVVSQDTASHFMFNHYSDLNDGDIDTRLIGNTFRCTDPANMCVVSNLGGATQFLAFQNNHLSNTIVDFTVGNEWFLDVSGNGFLFSRAFTGTALAARVTGSVTTGSPAYSTTAKVQGNMLNSLVAQPTAVGIAVKDNNYGNPDVYVVDNNIIRQFASSITTNTYGSNAGVTTQFFIRNNAVGGGTITSTDDGVQHSNVVKTGNLNDSGTAI